MQDLPDRDICFDQDSLGFIDWCSKDFYIDGGYYIYEFSDFDWEQGVEQS